MGSAEVFLIRFLMGWGRSQPWGNRELIFLCDENKYTIMICFHVELSIHGDSA